MAPLLMTMARQPKAYHRDESESDVDGIVVVDVGDDQLRVTEKTELGWCKPFWMPEQEFRAHTHGDDVTHVGQLADHQFDGVLKQAEA